MPTKIEDYCFLDDSTRHIEIAGLEEEVELYVSTLAYYPINTFSLAIARPKESQEGWCDLKEFLLERVGERKLVACKHYNQYEWLRALFSPEFVNKKILRRKNYEGNKKHLFKYAHKIVGYTAERLTQNLTKSKENMANISKFKHAIMNGSDSVSFGLEILLRGFEIPEL